MFSSGAEYAYAVGGADVDFAVGDGGGDVFVAGAEMVGAVGGLVAVVKFMQIGGIVGVEHGRGRVLDRPDNSVLIQVGGNAGSCAGIPVRGWSTWHGFGQQLSVLALEA